MKILKKSVSEHFASFYRETVAQIGIPELHPSHTPGLGYCRFENGRFTIYLRMDLSRANFEHHAAHELIHALQIKQGWPAVVSRHTPQSPVGDLGETLASIVFDLDVEERLNKLSFDSTYILDAQFRNLKRAILGEDIPSARSLRWRKGVMVYAYASLTQETRRWDKLRELFLRRAPHMESKGEEVAYIIKKNGWNTPDQALSSLIAVRKSIGLSSEQVGIIDRRTERRF